MRIGSLFSGAGGLDMAVEAVFGGEVVWQSEMDKAASKVLAYRFPGVPNLGDITAVDWKTVEPVDVLCGGYPCQPFSHAGKRKGETDERHLWPYFADAIRALRPRYAILENVAGHRSMGFDSVLADLAEMRYDAQWVCVRASDVGAPHRRERLFILAADAHVDDSARRLDAGAVRQVESEGSRRGAGIHGTAGGFAGDRGEADSGDIELLPTPCAQEVGTDRYDEWCAELKAKHGNGNGHGRSLSVEAQRIGRGDLLPTPQAFDQVDFIKTPEQIAEQALRPNGGGCRNLREVVVNELIPTPNASDGAHGAQHPDRRFNADGLKHSQRLPDYVLLESERWGKYEPAIRRWEQIAGPAPAPTEPNKNGNPRLFAAFSEWMMGWPAGWVTDLDIGISRNDQLRIIGNGVRPQQAVAALQFLLSVSEVAA